MSSCIDYGIDYPHAAVHCPACYAEQQQDRMVTEMRRANDLKQQELQLRDQRSEDETYWRPAPKPVRHVPAPATPPKVTQQNNERGGIGIEPRHRKSL